MNPLSQTAMPFNDVYNLIHNIPPQDAAIVQKHDTHYKNITNNPGDMGLFRELSRFISLSQNRYPPMVTKPEIALFVSNQETENRLDHTIKAQTMQIVENIGKGDHIINQICNITGCALKTYDLNSELQTEDITAEAAMSEVETTQVIAYSMEAVRDCDLLIISTLGLGQKIAPKAIIKAILAQDSSNTFNDYQFPQASQDAVNFHGLEHTSLEILRRLGSREIAAMVGAIVAARYQNVPVILDDLAALAAASLIFSINPNAITHCLVGHTNTDILHHITAEQIGLKPALSLGLSKDTGIGSAMLVHLIKNAIQINNYIRKK